MLHVSAFMLARRCYGHHRLSFLRPVLYNASLRRNITILAIETSCDDTAVAILRVNSKFFAETTPYAELLFNEKITSNNVFYQGIHPLVALKSHRKHLSALVYKATIVPRGTYGGGIGRPDLIAVTRGPGMRSNLMAGLDTAKGLAVAWQVPLVGVHHMQAHALTPRLCSAMSKSTPGPALDPAFPFLTLLVSGGHTLLLHSTAIVQHRILAETKDIAIGDCLDKCARSILPQHVLDSSKDVSYGRLLESFAFPNPGEQAYNETALSRGRGDGSLKSPYGWQLPVPLLATRGGQKSKSMEFSLTGLATSAIKVAENGWVNGKYGKEPRKQPMSEDEARFLAREVMRIAFEHLASRISIHLEKEKAAHDIIPTTPISSTLVISGGVAANQYLRHVFESHPSIRQLNIVIPPIDLCTDNAAMIAWAAYEMLPVLLPGINADRLAADKPVLRSVDFEGALEMDVVRKWSLENIMHPERENSPQEVIGDAAAGAASLTDAETKTGFPGSRSID